MKKITTILIGLLFGALVFASCKAPERCPAYGSIETVNPSNLG